MIVRRIRIPHVPRESDDRVLGMLWMWARGRSNPEIAKRFRMSSGAVSNQIGKIRDADTVEGDQSWAYRRGCAL